LQDISSPDAKRATMQLMTDTDGVDAILDQWQRERPDLDTSPIGVIGRISRLCREIERRLEPVYAASGLEPGWYDVLATLRRAGPPYRLRPTDFAAALMLTSSGTTKRLDRLEAAGYITRAGHRPASGQRAAHPHRPDTGRTAPARRPAAQAQHHPATA